MEEHHKIFCFFYGVIRNDLNRLKFFISEFKKNLNGYNVKYVFITYEPDKKFDYDKNFIIEEFGSGNEVLFRKSPDEHLTQKCLNGGNPIEYGFEHYISEFIKNIPDTFDYIIKIRADALISIKNISKYFSDKTVVAPRYWYNSNPTYVGNNHMYIMPYSKFIKLDLSYERINEVAKKSYDCEQVEISLIRPDFIISQTDIVEYKLEGSLKFHIKNGEVISANMPISAILKLKSH